MRRDHRLLATGVVAILLGGCGVGDLITASATPGRVASVRYVALGDSYTIGTGVPPSENWPNQLVERMRGTVELDLVANLAVNGYTSGDVIRFQLPALADLRPQFVSLLVGVNDVVQRVPSERYRSNVDQLLGALLSELPPDRTLVVSTPDYTRTPRGSDFGPVDEQRAAIAEVNTIMQQAASQRGIAFVDIGSVDEQVAADRAFVAGDLLHPSGEQYRRWVDLIAPVARNLLVASP